MLFIMWPYLRWTRRMMQQSFDLGAATAGHLKKLQEELTPVITDLKKAVADVRGAAEDFQKGTLKRIEDSLEKIAASMTVETLEDPAVAAEVAERRKRRGI